jgi:tRNA dimethylallyltransferase
MQGIGYKEVVGHLNGEYGKDEMAELIKKNTRNFAKRQMTWFKRFKDVAWMEPGNVDVADIVLLLNK